MLDVSLTQEPFVLFGINIGQSVVIAWMVLAVVLLVLFYFRYRISKFQREPRGLQLVLETVVDGVYRWAQGRVGKAAAMVAPITLTLMTYVACTTLPELFGIAPATEDLNCTIGLGLCTFLLVNVTGIRYRGVKGRIKGLASPNAAVFPIRVMTDCIAPFSMGIRLFANVLVGGVIMQLIYMAIPIIVPAAISAYFNLLHVGIQTYVFGLLTLIYVGEALGEEE